MTHAMFFNDTGRELKVHAGSSGVAFKTVPPTHRFCIEVPDGRFAFFKVWGDDVILIETVYEPVCPPAPLPKPAKGSCLLCERPRTYQWHYEDMDIWVADCPFCGDIVIAVKGNTDARHGVWPREGETLLRMVRRGLKRYTDLVMSTDRSCFPSHPHIHVVKK